MVNFLPSFSSAARILAMFAGMSCLRSALTAASASWCRNDSESSAWLISLRASLSLWPVSPLMIRARMAGFFSLARLCLSAAKASGLYWLAMSEMTCRRTLALG